MNAEGARSPDLDDAIGAIYGGPPEEFVSRRAALAKTLRAAARRDDANAIKRLRKPTRMAWALDAAVLDDAGTIERLANTVADTLDAQSGGGDVRVAFGHLRAAVQDLAAAAARAAAAHGHSIEDAALVPAVLAVIGEAAAFDALRAGRLADIPDGGGLDFLTRGPPRRVAVSEASTPKAGAEAEADAEAEAEAARAARDALRRAETALESASERSRAAERALRAAEARAAETDRQLRRAEEEAGAMRAELERARQVAKAAAANLSDADSAVADARVRLEGIE